MHHRSRPGLPHPGLYLRPLRASRIAPTETGRGTVIYMRARASVEVQRRAHKKNTIVVSGAALPGEQGPPAGAQSPILVKDKKLEGISRHPRRVRPRRHAHGPGAKAPGRHSPGGDEPAFQVHRRCRATFGINMLAIVNNRPEVLNLKQVLEPLHRAPPGDHHCGARAVSSWPRPRPGPTSWKASRSPWTTWTR